MFETSTSRKVIAVAALVSFAIGGAVAHAGQPTQRKAFRSLYNVADPDSPNVQMPPGSYSEDPSFTKFFDNFKVKVLAGKAAAVADDVMLPLAGSDIFSPDLDTPIKTHGEFVAKFPVIFDDATRQKLYSAEPENAGDGRYMTHVMTFSYDEDSGDVYESSMILFFDKFMVKGKKIWKLVEIMIAG